MYKQVYNKNNGQPVLIEIEDIADDIEQPEDIEQFEELEQPEVKELWDTEKYTDVPPSDSLYQPIYFDGNQWIGSEKEVWESNQPKAPLPVPDEKDELIANLSIQLLETQEQVSTLQTEMADLTLQVLEGGLNA